MQSEVYWGKDEIAPQEAYAWAKRLSLVKVIMNDQGTSWLHLQYMKGCALCCRLPGLSHIVAMARQFWGFRGPSCGILEPPPGALLGYLGAVLGNLGGSVSHLEAILVHPGSKTWDGQ